MIELLLKAENALSLGMLEQAERVYWQAIEHDPKNAIAIVGLSRVALERGDEWTAMDFAARALKIDPQNAMARRLIVRLTEVIERRGDGPHGMPSVPSVHPVSGDAEMDAAMASVIPGPSPVPAAERDQAAVELESGPAAGEPEPATEPAPEPAAPEPAAPAPEAAPEPAPVSDDPAPRPVVRPIQPPPAPKKRGFVARLFGRS